MPQLTIRRGGGYTDMLRAYTIELDGVSVGAIRRHETRTFDVTEGPHKVRVRIDWCGTPVTDVQVGPEGKTLVCRPNKLLPYLAIVLVFMPNQWLSLKEDAPSRA